MCGFSSEDELGDVVRDLSRTNVRCKQTVLLCGHLDLDLTLSLSLADIQTLIWVATGCTWMIKSLLETFIVLGIYTYGNPDRAASIAFVVTPVADQRPR